MASNGRLPASELAPVASAGGKHNQLASGKRRPNATWPSDDTLVALAHSEGSLSGIARACVGSREALQDFLRIRPELDAAVRSALRPPRDPAICTRCGGPNTGAIRYWCLSCAGEHAKGRREADPELAARRRADNRDYKRRNRARASERERLRKARIRTDVHVDRGRVFAAHHGRCGICGEAVDPDNFHVDHILPLARGGEHSYENTQPAHPICNQRKYTTVEAA